MTKKINKKHLNHNCMKLGCFKKSKKEISFICPVCMKKQTSIFESQLGSQIYEYNFESDQWDTIFDFEGEHEAFMCPNCDNDIDTSILPKKVLKNLGY